MIKKSNLEKKKTHELDSFDFQVLKLLQKNADYTQKEIAEKVNLSTSALFARVKKLQKEGYIRKTVALLDREKVGCGMVAFCNVSLKEHTKPILKKFEKEMLAFSEVVECYHIAGNFDYLLKVMVPDMVQYQQFIVHKLAAVDNVSKAQSMFVLSEVKYSTEVPV